MSALYEQLRKAQAEISSTARKFCFMPAVVSTDFLKPRDPVISEIDRPTCSCNFSTVGNEPSSSPRNNNNNNSKLLPKTTGNRVPLNQIRPESKLLVQTSVSKPYLTIIILRLILSIRDLPLFHSQIHFLLHYCLTRNLNNQSCYQPASNPQRTIARVRPD